MIELYIVLAICMAGCAGHATVQYLVDKEILDFDEESPSL